MPACVPAPCLYDDGPARPCRAGIVYVSTAAVNADASPRGGLAALHCSALHLQRVAAPCDSSQVWPRRRALQDVLRSAVPRRAVPHCVATALQVPFECSAIVK